MTNNNDKFKFGFIFAVAASALGLTILEGFTSQNHTFRLLDITRELHLTQDLLERDKELFTRQINKLTAELELIKNGTMDELCLGYDEYDADSIYDSELGMPKQ